MSDGVPIRPSDNVVVGAIAEATRQLQGREDNLPAALVSQRAMKITAAAMREVFEKLSWREIARCMGDTGNADTMSARVAVARGEKWWRDSAVEEVVGAIMANYIGERV